jgi:hypothetical protein
MAVSSLDFVLLLHSDSMDTGMTFNVKLLKDLGKIITKKYLVFLARKLGKGWLSRKRPF